MTIIRPSTCSILIITISLFNKLLLLMSVFFNFLTFSLAFKRTYAAFCVFLALLCVFQERKPPALNTDILLPRGALAAIACCHDNVFRLVNGVRGRSTSTKKKPSCMESKCRDLLSPVSFQTQCRKKKFDLKFSRRIDRGSYLRSFPTPSSG